MSSSSYKRYIDDPSWAEIRDDFWAVTICTTTAETAETLKKEGVKRVIDVRPTIVKDDQPNGHRAIAQAANTFVLAATSIAVAVALSRGGRVVVHCNNGRSRSPSAVMSFLMLFRAQHADTHMCNWFRTAFQRQRPISLLHSAEFPNITKFLAVLEYVDRNRNGPMVAAAVAERLQEEVVRLALDPTQAARVTEALMSWRGMTIEDFNLVLLTDDDQHDGSDLTSFMPRVVRCSRESDAMPARSNRRAGSLPVADEARMMQLYPPYPEALRIKQEPHPDSDDGGDGCAVGSKRQAAEQQREQQSTKSRRRQNPNDPRAGPQDQTSSASRDDSEVAMSVNEDSAPLADTDVGNDTDITSDEDDSSEDEGTGSENGAEDDDDEEPDQESCEEDLSRKM